MKTEQQKIINKFKFLSGEYHKLSLLFYELSQSLKIQNRNSNFKEFKQHIKDLNLDINKIKSLSKGLSNLSLSDIQKEVKK